MIPNPEEAVPGGPREADIYETLFYLDDAWDPPSTSVTISLHNYEQHIVPCLESVARQTMKRLDLVVVDDHSSDASADAALAWLQLSGPRFARSSLIRHKSNMGLAAARNTAFRLSRTEFVFVLDADNLLFPRCLDALSRALRTTSADFAYCYLEKFGETIALQNTRPWDPQSLQHGNSIDAMVLHRKRSWEAAGGFSEDMPVMGYEDFDLWFKLATLQGWGILVPEILGRYRVHRTSMLNRVTNPNVEKLWSYLRSRHPHFFR
jgi:glycosyltransferase involved in cell wall biosynthesis